MNVQYINPFVIASFSVLEMVLGNKPSQEPLRAQPSTFTSQQCNVVCGVTGQVQGQVIYGMSMQTAENVASTMLGGGPVHGLDALATSALGELGNMISGNAMQHLSEAGWICDITPPTIIQGGDVKISTMSIPAIVIPISLEQGEISVTVGLQGRK